MIYTEYDGHITLKAGTKQSIAYLAAVNIFIVAISYTTSQSLLSLMWVYWFQSIIIALFELTKRRPRSGFFTNNQYSRGGFLLVAFLLGAQLIDFSSGNQHVTVNGVQRTIDLGIANWRFILFGAAAFGLHYFISNVKELSKGVSSFRFPQIRLYAISALIFIPAFISHQKINIVVFASIKSVLDVYLFYITNRHTR